MRREGSKIDGGALRKEVEGGVVDKKVGRSDWKKVCKVR